MTATERFIKDAIEGGWKPESVGHLELVNYGLQRVISRIMLDPTAWQAVGKVRGWKGKQCPKCGENAERGHEMHTYDWHCDYCGLCEEEWPINFNETYIANMHSLIDALCEGKTIEDYLTSIE